MTSPLGMKGFSMDVNQAFQQAQEEEKIADDRAPRLERTESTASSSLTSQMISEAKQQLLDYVSKPEAKAIIGSIAELQLAIRRAYDSCYQDPTQALQMTGWIVSEMIEQVQEFRDGVVGTVFFSEDFDEAGFVDSFCQSVLKLPTDHELYFPDKNEDTTVKKELWRRISEDAQLHAQIVQSCQASMARFGVFEIAFMGEADQVRSLCRIYDEMILPALKDQVSRQTLKVMEAPTFTMPMMAYVIEQLPK